MHGVVCVKLIESAVSDGVGDQGAESALWGQGRVGTSVLEAVSLVHGSPFSAATARVVWPLGAAAMGQALGLGLANPALTLANPNLGPVPRERGNAPELPS